MLCMSLLSLYSLKSCYVWTARMTRLCQLSGVCSRSTRMYGLSCSSVRGTRICIGVWTLLPLFCEVWCAAKSFELRLRNESVLHQVLLFISGTVRHKYYNECVYETLTVSTPRPYPLAHTASTLSNCQPNNSTVYLFLTARNSSF